MGTIDLEQYKEDIQFLSDGQQINVDHRDCPAGTDTRKRLYLKRTSSGAVLAYCHHCNSKGYQTKQGKALKSIAALKNKVDAELETNHALVPYFSTAEEIEQEKPPYFKAWLTKLGYYAESPRIGLTNFIKYSVEQGRVYYPYWNELTLDVYSLADYNERLRKGELVLVSKDTPSGYQSRNINLNSGKTSKYITHQTDPFADTYSLIKVQHPSNQGRMVINILVEDLVSQYCVALACATLSVISVPEFRFQVWCCMGTSLHPVVSTALVRSLGTYGKGAIPLVWYDNDAAGKIATMKAQASIGYIDPSKGRDEPKYLPQMELYSILQKYTLKRSLNYASRFTPPSDEEQRSASEDRSSDQGTHSK